jgi:hypothetical protein
MRSFTLSVLCVAPTLFLSACGDNVPPGSDDDTAVDTTVDTPIDTPMDTNAGNHEDDTPRAIVANLDIQSPSCDAATASFEAFARHADDSSSVQKLSCRVTFDDGAVSDACVGEHTFASAGAHTFVLEAVDLDTGAVSRREVARNIAAPLDVDLALDVPACGLDVAFKATLNTGALVHVMMSPADKVVVPNVVGTTGSFQALEPGTYTVVLSAEDERATGPICVREVSRTVTLTACCE